MINMHFLVIRRWLIQSSLTVSSNRIVPCCDKAVLLHASGGTSCWVWGGYSWTAGRTGTGPRHRQPQTSPAVPGAGLVDKVLPTGLIGHLDELVLVALGQHSLHGSWETQVLSVCVRCRCLEQAAATVTCLLISNLSLLFPFHSFQNRLIQLRESELFIGK